MKTIFQKCAKNWINNFISLRLCNKKGLYFLFLLNCHHCHYCHLWLIKASREWVGMVNNQRKLLCCYARMSFRSINKRYKCMYCKEGFQNSRSREISGIGNGIGNDLREREIPGNTRPVISSKNGTKTAFNVLRIRFMSTIYTNRYIMSRFDIVKRTLKLKFLSSK